MPASILTTLVLWSSFLLPGGNSDLTRSDPSSRASCHSMTTIAADRVTIQASPIDRSTAWTLSDATSEEEESSDGDDNVIVGERCWTVSRLTLRGSGFDIPARSRFRFLADPFDRAALLAYPPFARNPSGHLPLSIGDRSALMNDKGPSRQSV